MVSLFDGAKMLPLRHISIRVPWNDTNWSGVICEKPSENISCLVLPRISETRNDEWETTQKCKQWNQLPDGKLPACVGEHGNFMAPFEITRNIIHPYSENGGASHKHFLPTPLRYPPYSAACIPYRWMLSKSVDELTRTYNMDFQQELEDQAKETMGFNTSWVQVKHNQLAMLDTFFSAIKPQSSLCIFYAKRTPFFEDNRRVIIGIGIVEHVGDYTEYNYKESGQIQSVLWERMIQHSIRPGMSNGFVLPYQELKKYLDTHPEAYPESYVAFAADEYLDAFSYGTEHVTNDVAIAALLSCSKALHNMKTILPGQWENQIQWIDQQLNLLWKMRGPCPGLGAALSAFGCENGTLFALEIERLIAEKAPDQIVDPWIYVNEIFTNPEAYAIDPSVKIGDMLRRKWQNLSDERRALLKLLSRFAITAQQATRYFIPEDKSRVDANIMVQDKEILENPYLLYELDRSTVDPISLSIIDRGLFPDTLIRDKFPIPQPSCITENVDERRVRAFIVRQLEKAAGNGNSLYARENVIQEIRELDVQPTCPVDGDLLAIVEEYFGSVIHLHNFANGQTGYQLDKLHLAEEIIRKTVQNRISGKRHSADINWRERLDFALKNEVVDTNDEQEIKAREEKTVALKELFESRISVLIGPAGTGKTTLLQVFCNEPSVSQNGLLLLAPTGKARVRMEEQTKIHNAKTIAQFLLPLDRYDPLTGIYRPSNREKVEVGKTIIIDEASMLTEEQLAAVFDAVKGVDRFILVGDPRQLPPIGAGRPFLDIVSLLAPENVDSLIPKIGKGYTELTIRRRQKGENRRDLNLAEWFSGRPIDPGADGIWGNPDDEKDDKTLRLVSWKNPSEFQNIFLEVLVEELKLDSEEDWKNFELSLGGTLYNDLVYFNPEYRDRLGSSRKIEDWQILSPVRANSFGVISLNRFIQNKFRFKTKEFASQRYRKIPKAMGREGILYGDKVIQVKNQCRWGVYPKDGSQQYVANGEIGIAVGQFKGSKATYKGLPWQIEVEFSTQPGFKYNYGDSDFGEEMEAPLELAYALTVHKTQGSEFKKTFVVIPNPCRLLSRELLYTALTRQREKVIILHQGDFHDLKRFSDDYYSEAASRLTNTFCPPNPVPVNDRFLEANLIHRTRRGESVRSKSEVIIANMLFEKHIEYVYEQALIFNYEKPKYPDFTIEDSDSGITYYWEHLGMLVDPVYRKRWEEKLGWYKSHNILPIEDGGGENGTLIITSDAQNGGIDSKAIEELIISSFS